MRVSPGAHAGDHGRRRYEHPDFGFGLDLPDGARVAAELPLVVQLARSEGQAYEPRVVVTAGDLDSGTPSIAAARRLVRDQLDALAAGLLIDDEPTKLACGEALRTLIHHMTDVAAVTLEQWWVPTGGRVVVLSASCETFEYDAFADVFAACAASFVPHPSAAC